MDVDPDGVRLICRVLGADLTAINIGNGFVYVLRSGVNCNFYVEDDCMCGSFALNGARYECKVSLSDPLLVEKVRGFANG